MASTARTGTAAGTKQMLAAIQIAMDTHRSPRVKRFGRMNKRNQQNRITKTKKRFFGETAFERDIVSVTHVTFA